MSSSSSVIMEEKDTSVADEFHLEKYGSLVIPFESKEARESTDRVAGFFPFRRWVDSFRSKKRRSDQPSRYVDGWPEILQDRKHDTEMDLTTYTRIPELQWESSSGTSSNLGTVQTASMSVASQSLLRSRATTQTTSNHSAGSDPRTSIDSLRTAFRFSIDEEAQVRAVKRREVLREIVTTEADYVFGLKALAEVLFMFSARPGVYHNVLDICETHETFLARIRSVTPPSSLANGTFDLAMSSRVHTHRGTVDLSHLRFKAFHNKSLRTRKFKAAMDLRFRALAAEASAALAVAKEIGRLSLSLAAYEEFCNNYQQLEQDMNLLRRTVSNWPIFDQGIEALSKCGASSEIQGLENKSMTINDLLIKPIQRLCKYPLLLQELLKHTHIQDSPSAHDGIRQVLETVRARVGRINEIPGNPVNKDLLHKTLLLQSMLELPASGVVYNVYKQLGAMVLCGVLHVTYQSAAAITGSFMVCVLFRSHFFLAQPNDSYRKLEALLCLYVCDIKIDVLRNRKGLCCHGCLHSWKLDFQHQGNRYELVLSAASATEAMRWNTEMLKAASGFTEVSKSTLSELRATSLLSLELKPLDGDPSLTPHLTRRPSMNSLNPSWSQPNMQHMIIKKTHSPNQTEEPRPNDSEIERSNACNALPTLTLIARRQERIRLERYTRCIYTRHILPYPGMVSAKGDLLLGTESIIRRLSYRPGLYRRSSSVNIPPRDSAAVHTRVRKGATDNIYSATGNGRQDTFKFKLSHGKERHVETAAKGPGAVRRTKTLRRKAVTRPASTSTLSPPKNNGDSPEIAEISLKTSIRTMFNSISRRRSKKKPRVDADSGVW